jgi:alcohol dehydrogenase
MKVRAALLKQQGLPAPYATSRPLELVEIDLAPPGPGEVLVKTAAAGLCHSDLSIIAGERPRTMPMVLGHEAAGVVEAVGEGVNDLQKGDHVVMLFVPGCGRCAPCAEGHPVRCGLAATAAVNGTLITGAKRMSFKCEEVNHMVGVSAYAEYAVLARQGVLKIDKELPLDIAALFGCAVMTGVGAAVNTAQVRPGETVAVIGLGGVGLSALMGAVVAGASRIVAVDLDDRKLAFAQQLGATDIVNSGHPDAVAKLRDMTDGGVHHALEMVGAAKALEFAYAVTRRGGTTTTVGLPAPTATFVAPIGQMVVEERTVKGSYMGSCVPQRDVPRFVSLYRQGKLPVDKLLSAHIKFEDINEGFDRLARGDVIRQIIRF